MVENIGKIKNQFLEIDVLTMTLNAALQTRSRNGKIYADGVDAKEKPEFNEFLRRELKNLTEKYKAGISEEEHVRNIEIFSDKVTDKFHPILYGNRFRIGVTQKLLNLWVKHLWVLGWLDKDIKPPHCPFDNLVLGKLKGVPRECRNWTLFDSIECYQVIVDSAEEVAGKSLAEWELELWNKEVNKKVRVQAHYEES